MVRHAHFFQLVHIQFVQRLNLFAQSLVLDPELWVALLEFDDEVLIDWHIATPVFFQILPK